MILISDTKISGVRFPAMALVTQTADNERIVKELTDMYGEVSDFQREFFMTTKSWTRLVNETFRRMHSAK